MSQAVPPRSSNSLYPKIGELRHRIVIEESVKVSDGVGGQTETWQTVATVWAKIDPVAGLERFFAERIEENITHKITIRYRTGIDTEMRISFDGHIFQIRSVRRMLERKDFIQIDAVEGTAT